MNFDNNTAQNSNGDTYLRDRSQMEMDVDNIMRRALRISDPRNVVEVSEALGKLFETDRGRMRNEAAGINVMLSALPTIASTGSAATDKEIEQAVNDVKSDLTALINDNRVKDIKPELRGWSNAIDSIIKQGVSSARLALDPRQRNNAFLARRMLNDYSRLARYVGALTPTMNLSYRRLAQSLDEVAAVILVTMGEALSQVGAAGGHFLMQVASSDLQERRDNVIYALRNFIRWTPETSTAQEQWPRGIVSYRQLLQRLDLSGQGDLKSLLQENTLIKMMDELIDRASPQNIEGLRALGATATVNLEGFQRLISYGINVVDPESPPLASFFASLQLFLDCFTHAASGYRLLFVARPPLVYYGLYGLGGPNVASRRLLELVIQRGLLAEKLDCFLGCNCGSAEVKCQIMLDKILYDVDRAIDLYAQGGDDEGKGQAEQRATAYSYLMDTLLEDQFCMGNEQPQENRSVNQDENCIKKILSKIQSLLCEMSFSLPQYVSIKLKDRRLVWVQIRASKDQMSGQISNLTFGEATNIIDKTKSLFDVTIRNYIDALGLIQEQLDEFCNEVYGPCTVSNRDIEEVYEALQNMHHELCLQRRTEVRWQHLLHTMAPSCVRFNSLLDATDELVEKAMAKIAGGFELTCQENEINIPATLVTTQSGLTTDRHTSGRSR